MIASPGADGGSRFAAIDGPGGLELPDTAIETGLIVESGHVHFTGQPVVYGLLPLVEACGNRPIWIFAMANLGQETCNPVAVRGLLFAQFIPDAVHDQGRVVAVPAYHINQITLSPVVEPGTVAVFDLRKFPLIERFVNKVKAHLIAKFQHGRVMGIVRSTDGI